jgi:ATP-dependent DNA helicase RecQ
MPPYVVFHDSTLAAMAAARPGSADELARIKGVGPAKLAAYGEALLRLMHQSPQPPPARPPDPHAVPPAAPA